VAETGPGRVVAPTRTDPVARSLSEVVGGPVGRHGRAHRWWTPVRVLLAVFTIVFAVGQIVGPTIVGWIAAGPGGLARGLVFSACALWLGAAAALRQRAL